ncbi:MAG TPA: hypothetical protein DCZ20_09125 [Lachnospiraceae bacterium]|nr:hypothetical protein [Lachnospiraceae bacterium]
MRKRFLGILLCVVMAVSMLIGCGSSDDTKDSEEKKQEESTDKQEETGEKQKITIAIGNAYKPFCYLDENEKPAGYEYDLFLKVAEKMADKYEVEVVCDSWDNLFAGLETGKYDIISHHLAYNAERAEKYNVSSESLMYFGEYRFIYKKGRTDITDIASVAGMTLANSEADNIGKVLAAYNEEHPDNPIILQETMPSAEAIIAGIENGLYDAYTHTQFDLQTKYIDMYPDADLELGTVGLLDGDVDCGTYAVLKKGNDDLQADFDATIKALREDGTIKDISVAWFDADYSTIPE